MFAFLCFFPYRHHGENDINRKIEAMNASQVAPEKETVTVV